MRNGRAGGDRPPRPAFDRVAALGVESAVARAGALSCGPVHRLRKFLPIFPLNERVPSFHFTEAQVNCRGRTPVGGGRRVTTDEGSTGATECDRRVPRKWNPIKKLQCC